MHRGPVKRDDILMHVRGHIMTTPSIFRTIGAASILCAALGGLVSAAEPAAGPLRILKSNPRYFTDGSGKAIYLAGSHNWGNFEDNGHRSVPGDPPAAFDYDGYLEFLANLNHNFFRLWRWETPKWTDDDPPGVKHARPHPWARTGPGLAHDQKPKFDLTHFDPEYFERMRSRITAAGRRGMYVSIMLFEGWGAQTLDVWACHPFHSENNVNGVEADADGDGRGIEFYTLHNSVMGKRVLELQEAYLRKVIDTVNDLDNVLYEVCNEAGSYSTEWQYYVIRFVHDYEAQKAKQHPVGMTFQYRGGNNAALFDSPADWVSPNTGDPQQSYLENPPASPGGKVIVNDTDHLCGHNCGDAVWVWKSFCRGLNLLFMEELNPSPTWRDSARMGMGQTRRYAEKVDLAATTPRAELSSTRYCLANAGEEYLVLQPGNSGQFRVDLRESGKTFAVEWLDISNNKTLVDKPVRGGDRIMFNTPFPGPAVLYLKAN